MVHLLDSTLREGQQAPDVKFNLEQKTEIALALDAFGVNYIEVGHPAISTFECDCIKYLSNLGLNAELLGHARANISDVNAVYDSGCQWVGIFVGVNELSRKNKLNGRSIEEVAVMVKDSISYAKSLGLKVRFTVEDGTRTEMSNLVYFAKLAESAGANRFSIADSLGLAAPDSIRKYIHDLRKEVKLGLEVHLHNDLGLATANSLSAYESGVEVVDVSILGIGERAGITPLEDFAVLLYKLKGDHVGDLSMIMPMCEMVSKYAGIPINPMKQIVGANAFKHTARLHRLAVDQDPTCYEFIDPEILGLSSYQATTTQLLENLIGVPFVRGAEELIGHRNGQGTRHVFMDNRVIPGSSFYIIIRDVDDIDSGLPGHVDMHSHNCDSAFLFVGKNPDFSGLSCEVYLGDLTKKVDSPASVFIPNGIPHAYRLVSGSGFYINILSTTDYNPATETVRK